MKCMIAFACLLAVASAGYLNSAVVYGAEDDGSYKGEFYNGALGGVYAGALGYASLGSKAVAYNAPLVSAAQTYAAPFVHAYSQGYNYAAPIAVAQGVSKAVAYNAPLVAARSGSQAVAYNAPLVSAPHPVRVAQTYAAPLIQSYAQGYNYAAPIAVAQGVSKAVAYNAPLVAARSGSQAVAYNAPLVSAPHPVRVAQTYAAPLIQSYAQGYAPALSYSGYSAPIARAYGYAHAAPLALASEARLVDPVAIAAGAPLPTGDTVEVAAAKAVHFQAHAAAKGIAYSAYSPALAYSGYNAAPFAHGYGYAHASPLAYGYAHAAPLALASEARLIDPVAIAAGAPLPTGDTVEVAAAKAFHHQAHVEAKTGHLLAKSGHFITKRSPGYLNTAYTTPLAYSTPVQSYGYSSYASPLAYSGYTGYTGYGYGGHLGAYYG